MSESKRRPITPEIIDSEPEDEDANKSVKSIETEQKVVSEVNTFFVFAAEILPIQKDTSTHVPELRISIFFSNKL